MTNFSIGPTPIQLVGAGLANEPLTVQNSGAVSIYLSADPGVTSSVYEYKIDAGGDFTWPPGKPLSVCTAKGVVGQISFGGTGNVRVNSGSTNVTGAVTINGTVPISGPVTVSGTVGISGGSVNLAGPVAISGGVSVTGSTINVGNSIALANIPVLVYSTNLAIGAGAGTYSTTLSTTAVIQAYSSILIVISTTKSGGGVFPLLQTNYVSLTVSCQDGGGAGRSSVYNPQWMYVTQGNGPPNTPYQQSLQIPVTNTNMSIQANVIVAAGYAGNVNISVYGTGQTITGPLYKCDGDGFAGTIPEGGLYSKTIAGVTSGGEFVATKNGLSTYSTYEISGTSSGVTIMSYFDGGNYYPCFGIQTVSPTPAGSTKILQPILPLRPVNIYATNTVAGQSYSINLTQ